MPENDHEHSDGAPYTRHARVPERPYPLPRPGSLWVPVGRAVLAATPKVASTAIRNLTAHRGTVPADKVHLYDRVIGFLRDPLERLESAFHYFNRRGHFPQGYDVKLGYATHQMFDTYEKFVDAMLDRGYLDKHWMPQMYNMRDLPTEYHPLEDLDTVLRGLGVSVGKGINSSGVAKTRPQYRIPELEAFYASDLAARETSLEVLNGGRGE